MRAVLLGVVEDNALLQLLAGRRKVSEAEAGDAQRIVGLHKDTPGPQHAGPG